MTQHANEVPQEEPQVEATAKTFSDEDISKRLAHAEEALCCCSRHGSPTAKAYFDRYPKRWE